MEGVTEFSIAADREQYWQSASQLFMYLMGEFSLFLLIPCC